MHVFITPLLNTHKNQATSSDNIKGAQFDKKHNIFKSKILIYIWAYTSNINTHALVKSLLLDKMAYYVILIPPSHQTSSHYIFENVVKWTQTVSEQSGCISNFLWISWMDYKLHGRFRMEGVALELWACSKCFGGHPVLSFWSNIFKSIVRPSLVWWGYNGTYYCWSLWD